MDKPIFFSTPMILALLAGQAAKASHIASTMANRAINPRAHELLLCIMPISSHYGAVSSVAGRNICRLVVIGRQEGGAAKSS